MPIPVEWDVHGPRVRQRPSWQLIGLELCPGHCLGHLQKMALPLVHGSETKKASWFPLFLHPHPHPGLCLPDAPGRPPLSRHAAAAALHLGASASCLPAPLRTSCARQPEPWLQRHKSARTVPSRKLARERPLPAICLSSTPGAGPCRAGSPRPLPCSSHQRLPASGGLCPPPTAPGPHTASPWRPPKPPSLLRAPLPPLTRSTEGPSATSPWFHASRWACLACLLLGCLVPMSLES